VRDGQTDFPQDSTAETRSRGSCMAKIRYRVREQPYLYQGIPAGGIVKDPLPLLKGYHHGAEKTQDPGGPLPEPGRWKFSGALAGRVLAGPPSPPLWRGPVHAQRRKPRREPHRAADIPLLNPSVLPAGIDDSPRIMKELIQQLVKIASVPLVFTWVTYRRVPAISGYLWQLGYGGPCRPD